MLKTGPQSDGQSEFDKLSEIIPISKRTEDCRALAGNEPIVEVGVGGLLEQFEHTDTGREKHKPAAEIGGGAQESKKLGGHDRDHGGSEPEEYADPTIGHNFLRRKKRL